MFETAELGRSISRKALKKAEPKLRSELLRLQQQLLREKEFRGILVFAGVDGAGKSETVGLLNQWMDARWLSTCAYDEPTEAEKERPDFWRYWRDLPPRGRIGMFMSAWYSQPVLDRVHRNIDEATFLKQLDRIVAFETALVEEGALILKFWMHLSRDAQVERLRALEADPVTASLVGPNDWEHCELYDRFIAAAEQVVARTNTGKSPWTIIEGADANYRSLTVTTMVRDAIRRRFAAGHSATSGDPEVSDGGQKKGDDTTNSEELVGDDLENTSLTVLNRLDLDRSIDKRSYKEQLHQLQSRLHHLHLRAKEKGISNVLVFEGPDAAGKGGAIRRVTSALQPRNYQVHGVAAPTEEERLQHYLWRFWRHVSRAGRITIFDRSWYGRVLVERIEGFASEREWRRAYAEINDFEMQLIEHDVIITKFWIHISKDEQLARFKAREATEYKSWKLTDEDWRNRKKWHDYELAVHDMVQYSSTRLAPWVLVEGNDKRFARIKVLQTLCNRLALAVGDEDNSDVAEAAQ